MNQEKVMLFLKAYISTSQKQFSLLCDNILSSGYFIFLIELHCGLKYCLQLSASLLFSLSFILWENLELKPDIITYIITNL